MMRRIRSLIARDLKSSARDYIVLYSLLAPLLVALILRAFIPSVGEATVNLVVTADTPVELIEALRGYGSVEVRRDRGEVEARVLQLDDAMGIIPVGETYEIVLEGNESEEARGLPALILAEILGPPQVAVVHHNLGRATSPVRPFVSTMMPLMAMVIAGFFIGINIVEDKESNMIPALGTSPLSRLEYIAGRSLLAAVVSLGMSVAALFVLGTWPVNLPQVLMLSAGAAVLAIILGLYIGSVATNQIEAIGVLKLGSIPFVVVPLLVYALGPSLHWTMYWLPTYWTAAGFKAMFLDGADWSEVARLAATGLGVSLLFLLVSWRNLNRRLALRG